MNCYFEKVNCYFENDNCYFAKDNCYFVTSNCKFVTNTCKNKNNEKISSSCPRTSPSTFANRRKASLPPVFAKELVLFPSHGLPHSFVHKGSYPLIPHFLGKTCTCIYSNCAVANTCYVLLPNFFYIC